MGSEARSARSSNMRARSIRSLALGIGHLRAEFQFVLAAIPSSSPPAQIIVWRLGCWPLSADQPGGFFFCFCWARSVDAAVRDAPGARPKIWPPTAVRTFFQGPEE